MGKCKKCGKELSNNEIALHRRLIDVESKDFLCKYCIAEYFGCTVSVMENKIMHFINLGCELFLTDED